MIQNPKMIQAGKLMVWRVCGSLSEGAKRTNAEEGTQRRTDRVCVEAGGNWQAGARSLPGDGHIGAGVLHLEAEVRRLGLNELRQLREENRNLKTLVADLTLRV